MHVEPSALELAPQTVRQSYAHIWQPAEVLLTELERFPLGLLRTWHAGPRGHIVFTHRPSRYLPGPQPWHETTLESVCYISVAELRQDQRAAICPLLNLFDHLLGSGAAVGEAWLSDGGGITEALREVGQRFVHIYALGYARDELRAETAHDYLARTLWCYLDAPQRLNVLDPLVYKLYHHTLMRESFWPQAQSA